MGGLGSLVAVITGHLSRSNAKKQGRNPSGLALAGVMLGYLGLAGTALFVVLIVAVGGRVSKAIDRDDHAHLDLLSAAA
ncbi:MAG: hypothetical protein JWO22_3965, partial [Frankiales bacterium]|nr:hypothetical protein [Frankiales bacterium]